MSIYNGGQEGIVASKRLTEIECNEELKNTLTLKIDEEGNLEVRYPTSSRFVGESILLKLFSNDILQDTLEVVIKSI